jgi:hypothetical protein
VIALIERIDRSLHPADGALTEDFEPVTVDLEVGPAAKLVEQRLDAAVLELDHGTTI